jgi:hypothetical protein
LKSFFQSGVKRSTATIPEIPIKKPHLITAPKTMDKMLKKDLTRKQIDGGYSSQESEGSDHEEILQKVFGVNRGRGGGGGNK